MNSAVTPPATTPHQVWGRVSFRPARRTADRAMKIIATSFTLLAIFVLFSIIGMLLVKGIGGLSVATFTQVTPGPGSEGGGLANAIVGSIVLTFLGIAVATPVGVLAGTYLAEYGKGSKLADLIRFINDILFSAPSIIIGLFVYVSWSADSAAISRRCRRVALAILASRSSFAPPRTCSPGADSLREAGTAIGAPRLVVITASPTGPQIQASSPVYCCPLRVSPARRRR